jgi:peroxiredoxin Q/BCP
MLFFPEPLPEGSRAPEFRCRDDRGQEFALSERRGTKVVLVFYPADNTPVCTAQLCELRDSYAQLAESGAAVYGINTFGAASHSTFREKHRLPFPLLVDSGKRVAKLYRANGWFVVKRTVYVIDEDGVIVFARRGRPAVEEILAAVTGG